MLLFTLWAMLVLGALAGAGYSHYRYRVINNQYYERIFARDRQASDSVHIERNNTHGAYVVPVLTLVTVGLLVPVSFVI